MNIDEVGQVLAMVASYDPYQRREPDQAQRTAWALAIGHSFPEMTLELAGEAVVRFHAEIVGRPMSVGDLIAFARKVEAVAVARERAEAMRARLALPEGQRPEPSPVRDRRADLRALLSGLVDQFGNWDPVGDVKTRASQAARHPDLAAKYADAKHVKARRLAQERTAERQRRIAAGLDAYGDGDE